MGDLLADRLHDARALVSEHDRPAPVAEVALGEMQVGVAHAGGGDAHQHLVGVRRVKQQLLDAHRLSLALEHRRADLDRRGAHATR